MVKQTAAKQASEKKNIRPDKGASTSKVGFRSQLESWLKDHKRVSRDSLRRLFSQPVNSLVTWLVIGIALALPVGLYVALGNVHELSGRWDGDAQISVFLHQRVSAQSEQRLQQQLQAWPEIASIHIISKDQALEEFQAISGFADVLQHLDHNPLPTVLEIAPTAAYSDIDGASILLEKLQALPPVELAQR